LLICPKCESGNVQKRGFTKTDPPKQIVLCLDCDGWSNHAVKFADEPVFNKTATQLSKLSKSKTLLITSAQNNTPLHLGFWGALQTWAKAHDAQILVIPAKYRNPTNPVEAAYEEIWYPKEVIPFMMEDELPLGPNTVIMGQVRVAATASNPLSGLDPLIQGRTAIFGHAQISMQVVAAPQHKRPAIMHTTGSASMEANYSKSKAGIKAKFHHSLGAVLLESDGKGHFHPPRSVSAGKDGAFYDLGVRYFAEGKGKQERIKALITGDEHAMFNDPGVKRATYTDPGSLAKLLRPEKIVRHDVFDGWSISHHHRRNAITQFVKWKSGTASLEDELDLTVRHIDETTPEGSENVIVPSNHHDHLMRWLNEADPKHEPWNAIVYHELMLACLREARLGKGGAETIDPFAHYAAARLKTPTRFLRREQSEVVEGVEISLHGDLGINGARGSIKAFSKIGIRSVVGHSHTPGIEKGCYQVGTSTGMLEYTKGPSSWISCHCIVNPDGKRQLVFIVEGRFRP
jgi:hypothetical protein